MLLQPTNPCNCLLAQVMSKHDLWNGVTENIAGASSILRITTLFVPDKGSFWVSLWWGVCSQGSQTCDKLYSNSPLVFSAVQGSTPHHHLPSSSTIGHVLWVQKSFPVTDRCEVSRSVSVKLPLDSLDLCSVAPDQHDYPPGSPELFIFTALASSSFLSRPLGRTLFHISNHTCPPPPDPGMQLLFVHYKWRGGAGLGLVFHFLLPIWLWLTLVAEQRQTCLVYDSRHMNHTIHTSATSSSAWTRKLAVAGRMVLVVGKLLCGPGVSPRSCCKCWRNPVSLAEGAFLPPCGLQRVSACRTKRPFSALWT